MSGLPNKVSESVRKLNPHIFSGEEVLQTVKRHNAQVAKNKIIRVTKSQEERLNKTEQRFLAYLRTTHPGWRIGIQDVCLRLAADCRFYPDFSLWPGNGNPL